MVPTPHLGSGGDASRLGLDHHADGRAHNVAATGELDLVEAPRLEQLVEELTRDQVDLVLDLDQLGFLDSTGVRAILVANQMVERSGGTMTVTLENPKVRRIVEVSGLLGTGPFVSAGERLAGGQGTAGGR